MTASVMADILQAIDIPFMFGYPGTSNIEFMEGARQRGIETILARREGTAAFMAESFGMLTGRPGICISTLGPGSTNMVNGVAAATLDRAPMIAISGQIPRAQESYFTHQVVDQTALFAPVTKWAGRVEPSTVTETMCKAISLSTAERPGAVHLTVPSDVAAGDVPDVEVRVPPISSHAVAGQLFVADGAQDPRSHLRESRRPIMLVGGAVIRQGAMDAVRRLAEATNMPVLVSPMAKGVFPEDDLRYAGTFDMACNDLLWKLTEQADLILAVGFDPVELIKQWSVRTPVMHIDAVRNTDQVYPADIELIGAISPLLDWLMAACDGSPKWDDAELDTHRSSLQDAYYAGQIRGRLNPTDVIDVVQQAVPADSIVTTDVGSHKLLVGQGWKAVHPRTVLMSNGLSSMGFALPAAIGAKLTMPDRTVVCTTGDGGFAMVQSELRLAAALGLGIAVIVFVDNSLNRIELKQLKLKYPSTATRIESTDLVRLAESMDCHGAVADDVPSLERELTGIASLDRPLVIEARIDPSQYESQF